MSSTKCVLFLILFLFSIDLLAAVTSSTTAATEKSPFFGVADIRPTWTTREGSWITDNSLEAGYAIDENTKVSYVQFFQTNLLQPKSEGGLNLSFPGGFFRAKFNNIWKSADERTGFHYQPRVYLPMTKADFERGMVTVIRNYFTLSRELSKNISVSFVELPMLHVTNKAGVIEDEIAFANPLFENRVYLMADVIFSEKLSMNIPLFIHATKHRNYRADAENNSGWSYFVYVWPEITYAYSDVTSFGLAYYSSNLVKADFSGLTLGEGLEKGAVQLVATFSL